MKFTGTKDYVATDDLKIAVNASIVLDGIGKVCLFANDGSSHVCKEVAFLGVSFLVVGRYIQK